MSRILAYTSPARGHLFPLVPILDELHERGHAVHLRTLDTEVPTMQDRGVVTAPIDPTITAIAHDDYLARTPTDGLKRSVAVFGRRAPLDAADLRRAVEEVDPHLLLIDINAWGAAAAAEASGLPWASWCPYPLPVPSRSAPPFGPGLPPARGPLGRLRDRALRPIVFGSAERIMVPPVNDVRARLGLPPIRDARELFSLPPRCLYLTAEPFEYPRDDWPDNIHQVGPIDWDPPATPPTWLAELDTPVVLVTTSSEFQDDGVLAQVALEALATEDVTVVVTVPSGSADAFDLPDNGRVETFLPHGPVLERAVCAVTHGGMGATQKALGHGVPVVAVPFGRDQLEVARRVEQSGAGVRLPKRHLRPDRLRAAVRVATTRREDAQRLARSLHGAGGPTRAADLLEEALVDAGEPDPIS